MTKSDSSKKSDIPIIWGAAGNPKGIINARGKIRKNNSETEDESKK